MGPSLHLTLCACKTTRLASKLLFSMGPSLHLWFLHPKLRLYDQNNKSQLVPHLTYGFFCIQHRDFSPKIASHYGSQPSSVVLCTHNSRIITRINSLYGSQTSPVVLCMQCSVISTRITSIHGSQTHVSFRTRITSLYWSQSSPMVFCIKSSDFSTRIAYLYGSQSSSVVFACKTRLLELNYKSLWVPDLTYGFVHAKQRD